MNSSRTSRRVNLFWVLQKLHASLLTPFRYIKNNPIYSSAMFGALAMLVLYICGLALVPSLFYPIVATGGFIINLASAVTCAYYGVKRARQNPVPMLLGGFAGFVIGALCSALILKVLPAIMTYVVSIAVVGVVASGFAFLLSAVAANSIVTSITWRATERARQRNWQEREEILNADPTLAPASPFRRVTSSTARVITQTVIPEELTNMSLELRATDSPNSSSTNSSIDITPSWVGTPEPRPRSVSTDEADSPAKSIHYRSNSR